MQRAGGLVSYKTNPDGSQSAYELNVNYLDALAEPERRDGLDLAEARFLVAQAIMLALQGVPGIYVHSLLGSRGWPEGAERSGQKRTINRQKFAVGRCWPCGELRDPHSRRGRIYRRMSRLLRARAGCPAFDPFGVAARDRGCTRARWSLLRESGGGAGAVPVSTCAMRYSACASMICRAAGATSSMAVRRLQLGEIALAPDQVLWMERVQPAPLPGDVVREGVIMRRLRRRPDIKHLRIGFISTRFSGTDGVSLETAKWARVLEEMGHTCFYFAGMMRPA